MQHRQNVITFVKIQLEGDQERQTTQNKSGIFVIFLSALIVYTDFANMPFLT